MATAVKFGFDEAEIGTASVEGGLINVTAADEADRDYITGVLETYHGQLADGDDGPREVKPMDLLSHVAGRMRGRAWAEETEAPPRSAGKEPRPVPKAVKPAPVVPVTKRPKGKSVRSKTRNVKKGE